MNVKQQFADHGVEVTRREYDDRDVLAADLGAASDASVDVVGDTVIVVTPDDQFEVRIDGEATAVINNGVLTIEVVH
jgi:hypothetical protein